MDFWRRPATEEGRRRRRRRRVSEDDSFHSSPRWTKAGKVKKMEQAVPWWRFFIESRPFALFANFFRFFPFFHFSIPRIPFFPSCFRAPRVPPENQVVFQFFFLPLPISRSPLFQYNSKFILFLPPSPFCFEFSEFSNEEQSMHRIVDWTRSSKERLSYNIIRPS